MKAIVGSALVLCGFVCTASTVTAQTPVGALAIDERQGDQYGWAVDYETALAAQSAALRECGGGCSVVLTFERCAAYAADQDADSTAVGWAESYSSSAAAQQAALGECSSRGRGSGCIVRVWGCNGPVVEDGLRLDRAARRQVQEGLQAAASTPVVRTGCSGRVRGRRSGAGRRPEGHERRAIWTGRRWRRCGRRWRGSRRSASGRRQQRPRQRRASFPLRRWRSCSGSRSQTALTLLSSRCICRSSLTACSECWLKRDWRRCGRLRTRPLRPPAVLPAVCPHRPPHPGRPALAARRSMARPASTRRGVLGTFFVTVLSARRWW